MSTTIRYLRVCDRHTCLQLACEKYGSINIVKLLLSIEDIKVNLISESNSRCALHLACQYGHIDIIKLLFEHTITHQIDWNIRSDKRRTPFLQVCYSGQIEILKIFLDNPSYIDWTATVIGWDGEDGWNGLHLALYENIYETAYVDLAYLIFNCPVCKDLVSNFISSNIFGDPPLHFACKYAYCIHEDCQIDS